MGHSGKNNFRELTIGSITEADNSEYLLGRASLAYNINIGFGLFLKLGGHYLIDTPLNSSKNSILKPSFSTFNGDLGFILKL